MKVAFATTGGMRIDEHFGRAGAFAVYDVGAEGYELAEVRKFAEEGPDVEVIVTRGMGRVHDEALEGKVDRLADCRIVYFTEIGAPSAAKLVRRGVMPLKAKDGDTIGGALDELVEKLRSDPPPWLRKALAADPGPSATG